jgi:hypothetical protein
VEPRSQSRPGAVLGSMRTLREALHEVLDDEETGVSMIR